MHRVTSFEVARSCCFRKNWKGDSGQNRTLAKSYEFQQTVGKWESYFIKAVLTRLSDGDGFYRLDVSFILEIFL